MALTRDARYDVLLVDSPDGVTAIETLPILLREKSGGLDWGISLVSPYPNQLPAGDMQDNDNTRYSVRTQRDWRGGIGQEYSYQETDAFHSSLADSRFRNGVILPPKPQATTISGSGDPQFTPAQSGVSVGTRRAKAEWTTGSRVDGVAAASAAWAASNTSWAGSDASVSWAATSAGYASNGNLVASISTASGNTRVATSFVMPANGTMSGVSVRFAVAAGSTGAVTVGLQADSAGAPSGTFLNGGLASNSFFSNVYAGGGVQTAALALATPQALTAGVTYWLVIAIVSGSASMDVYGGTASLTGTGKSYNVSLFWSTAAAWNIYFSPSWSVTPQLKSQTSLAQSFVGGNIAGSVSVTSVKLYLSRTTWTGSPTVTMKLCSDSGGAPGSTLKSATISDPGGTAVLTTISFTAQTLNFPTAYWIVIEVDAATTSDAATVQWYRDANGNFPNGSALTVTTGGGWAGVTGDFYFEFNTGYAGGFPAWMGWTVSRTRLAMSFVGNGTAGVTSYQIRCRAATWTGSPTARFSLFSNSAGAPNAEIAGVSMANPGVVGTWATLTLSAQTLTNAVTYWLVLAVDAPTANDAITIEWVGDTALGYSGGAAQSASLSGTAVTAWGAWGAQSIDLYFVVNALAAGNVYWYSHDQTRIRWAESFAVGGATLSVARIRFYAQQISRTTNATVSLVIAQNTAGAPGATVSSLALTPANFSSAGLAWVDVSIIASLSASTTYWWYIDCDAPAVGDGVQIDVGVDTAAGYTGACSALTISNFTSGAWTADSGADAFFIINNGQAAAAAVTVQPVQFNGAWFMASDTGIYRFNEVMNANTSFEDVLTGWTFTGDAGSATSYSLDATKGRKSLKINRTAGATQAFINTAAPYIAAAPGTIWQVSADVKAGTGVQVVFQVWYYNGASVYQGVIASSADLGGSGNWESPSFVVTAPAGCAYIAAVVAVYTAGDVYVDNVKIARFEWALKNNAGARVTALSAFAGKLYAALGDGNDMVESSDGNTWGATAGTRRYTYLRSYNGFLYAAKTTGGANALAYTDGSSWVTNLTVATAEHSITGLAGFNNELVVSTTRALFSLSSAYVYQIFDYLNDEDENNGKNLLTWMVDGKMYVPVRNGLNAYDGARMTSAGPDLNEGLPANEAGKIAALCGSKTWLFAAVDAGPTGTSSVMAFNGKGWHTIAKATGAGRRIRAIGVETTTSPKAYARLWWFEDSTPYFVEFPNLSDNPYSYTGVQYAATGFVTSSRFGGELSLIVKDFQSIFLWTDGCSAGQNVQVYYEIDNAGIWALAGTCTTSPSAEFVLAPRSMTNKTIAAGSTSSTINIAELTTDMAAGQFVRINNEVAQVATIASATQFTLAIPLLAAPSTGDSVYTSGPAGRQIRYRIVLNTNDTTKTPKVVRVALRIQPLFTAKARISFGPRVEDDLLCRTNTRYPYDASTLRTKLFNWFKRVKPYYLIDPYGRAWQVKNNSATESALTRQDEAPKQQRFKTYISAVVDEV
jgi:hypothetical protein